MSEERRPLRVAAMADLHVEEGTTFPCRELFAEIARTADVLVLAGDLTDLGKATEAQILARDIRGCPIPVLGVLGNHDFESGQVAEVSEILRGSGMKLLDGQTCEIDGVGFVGIKGFGGGFGRRMLTSFGEPATKQYVAEAMSEAMRLEHGLRTLHTERVFVILHYAPSVETLTGEPAELLPFLGCSRLAETIDRFKVDAVVHGHAHMGKYAGRTPGGVPVYNVASHIAKPTGQAWGIIEV